MKIYGKHDFGKAITLNGKPHGIESIPTLPAWAGTDAGRIVYAEDTGLVWAGNATKWLELTPGGVGAHDHPYSMDDIYNNGSTIAVDDTFVNFELAADKQFHITSSTDSEGLGLSIVNQAGTRMIQANADIFNVNAANSVGISSGGSIGFADSRTIGIMLTDAANFTLPNAATSIVGGIIEAFDNVPTHDHNAVYLALTGGTLSSDLTVDGDLTINGTTTTIESANTEVADSTFTIKTAETPIDGSASYEVQRAVNNAKILWDEGSDKWQLDPGTTVVSEILVASDIGVSTAAYVHSHDDMYYTETELNAGQLDNQYYTETEIDANIYTKTEIDTTLTGYSITSHDHSGTYEPVITPGTAFNKNFGAIAGSVSEGNHIHAAVIITYDNSTSGLTATDVKVAIDEVQTNIDNLNLDSATFEALDSAGDVGTAVDQVAVGNHLHDDRYYTETEINSTLTGYSITSHDHSGTYEPVFTKNTAFNKDFGTIVGTVTQGNDSRLSDARTPVSHDNTYHSETYITSTGVTYESLNTNGDVGIAADQVAPGDHVHNDIYYTETEIDSTFSGYSVTSHDHSGTYEPVITPNTAFNKDFGTVSGTVTEGDDSRLSDARTPTSHDNTYHSETYIVSTDVTYDNLNTNSDVGTGATQVAQGDHTHDDIYYTETELDAGQLDNRYFTETEVNTKFSNLLVPSTSGAPVDSPATGTSRFDASTDILYIYNGNTWVSITLS